MPFDLSTATPAKPGFDLSTATPMEPPRESSGADVALEGMAGVNRGAMGILDFFTTDQINALLQLAGPEYAGITDKTHRVPSFNELAAPATTGGYMAPGLGREVVGTMGEVIPAALSAGRALTMAADRTASAMVPSMSRQAATDAGAVRTAAAPIVAPTESTAAGALRQIGAAAPGADILYGAASGAGAEVGQDMGGDVGALVGALAAPLSVAGMKEATTTGGRMLATKINSMRQPVESLANDGVAALLSEAMVREGMSPEEAARYLQQLGPEGILADVGSTFAHRLRTSANEVPRIQGEAGRVLAERQAGQGQRIAGEFGDSTGTPGLSLADEIVRLETELKPQIDAAYKAAREKSETVLGGPRKSSGYSAGSPHLAPKPTKLQQLLDGENIGGPAHAQAQRELAAKRMSGEPVTKLDIVDATKRALDDQIKAAMKNAEMGKAASYLKLKHLLVKEADEAIPEYKTARGLYAGKAELETAGDLGREFFKMKPRELEDAVGALGESELRMFRLGAKEALMDMIDTMQISRDKVKALFMRGGDARKLRLAFESEEQFENFAMAMERESQFVRTRNTATGNSTTAQQQRQGVDANDVLDATRSVMGDPVAAASAIGRVIEGLGKAKGSAVNKRALELAGEILLERGMDPRKVEELLRKGAADTIAYELKKVAPKTGGAGMRNATVGGGLDAAKPRTSDGWGLTIVGDPDAN